MSHLPGIIFIMGGPGPGPIGPPGPGPICGPPGPNPPWLNDWLGPCGPEWLGPGPGPGPLPGPNWFWKNCWCGGNCCCCRCPPGTWWVSYPSKILSILIRQPIRDCEFANLPKRSYSPLPSESWPPSWPPGPPWPPPPGPGTNELYTFDFSNFQIVFFEISSFFKVT